MKRALFTFVLASCGTQGVKVEPVQIQPIHITVDVNVHDRADVATPKK